MFLLAPLLELELEQLVRCLHNVLFVLCCSLVAVCTFCWWYSRFSLTLETLNPLLPATGDMSPFRALLLHYDIPVFLLNVVGPHSPEQLTFLLDIVLHDPIHNLPIAPLSIKSMINNAQMYLSVQQYFHGAVPVFPVPCGEVQKGIG